MARRERKDRNQVTQAKQTILFALADLAEAPRAPLSHPAAAQLLAQVFLLFL